VRAHHAKRWRYISGLTLIELIVAMLVLAILASIAIPSYRGYVLRSQRTEATRALLQLRAAQEKFFLQNNRYATDLAAAPPDGLGMLATSESGLYDVSVALTDGGSGFRGTAVPRVGGPQAADTKCATFTLDDAGRRAALDGAGTDRTRDCWR
jgi:type IV pilus assembly protein PilE